MTTNYLFATFRDIALGLFARTQIDDWTGFGPAAMTVLGTAAAQTAATALGMHVQPWRNHKGVSRDRISDDTLTSLECSVMPANASDTMP
jgi:hypothetical protein